MTDREQWKELEGKAQATVTALEILLQERKMIGAKMVGSTTLGNVLAELRSALKKVEVEDTPSVEGTPKFKHYCGGCQFMGTDTQETDWYVCSGKPSGCRTIVRRFGENPEDYSSGTIGETVVPQRLIVRAARMGFKFNDAELRRFGEAYVEDFTSYKSIQDSKEGPACEDEELLKGEGQ